MSGTMPPTPDTPSAATGRGLTPKEYGESLRRSFNPDFIREAKKRIRAPTAHAGRWHDGWRRTP